MFKHYQLQGEEQYVFVFYPRNKDDVTFVKEHFITTLKSGDKPITDAESNKIKLDFIDNRTLSPIETGGAL